MRRRRQRLSGKRQNRSISFARTEERHQIRVCSYYLTRLMKPRRKLTILSFDTHLPILANLVPYLQAIEFNSPDDSRTIYGNKESNAFRSPFEHTFGQPMFEWLKANPTYLDHFNAYMAARRVGSTCWIDLLPPDHTLISGASTDPSAAFIVDIGGGRGHDLARLLETHPQLPGRAILQDLPQTIAENRKRGTTTTPFEMTPHDFFTPQPIKGKKSPSQPPSPAQPPYSPPSPGARIYHLHAILHDFADASCLRILAPVVAAMTPGYSHVVISEIVLPETGCALFPALMDMQMMVLCAGMERTEAQWRVLLGEAGLGCVRVYGGREGGEGVFVAVRE